MNISDIVLSDEDERVCFTSNKKASVKKLEDSVHHSSARKPETPKKSKMKKGRRHSFDDLMEFLPDSDRLVESSKEEDPPNNKTRGYEEYLEKERQI